MRPEDFAPGLERNLPDRARLQQHEEEFEREQAESYDEAVAEQLGSRAHHDDILAVIRAIVEHQPLELETLQLAEQERSALDALRTAFEGRDARYNGFVFAEQRRELLEQALAALQPVLAMDISRIPELHENYDRIVAEVTELRERLVNLEDAQDDERVHAVESKKEEPKDGDDGDKGDGDKGDKGDGELADDVEAAPKPSTVWDDPLAPAAPAGAASAAASADAASAASSAGPAAAADAPRAGVLSRLGRALGLGGKGPGEGT